MDPLHLDRTSAINECASSTQKSNHYKALACGASLISNGSHIEEKECRPICQHKIYQIKKGSQHGTLDKSSASHTSTQKNIRAFDPKFITVCGRPDRHLDLDAYLDFMEDSRQICQRIADFICAWTSTKGLHEKID